MLSDWACEVGLWKSGNSKVHVREKMVILVGGSRELNGLTE